jgi:hypothetical protein
MTGAFSRQFTVYKGAVATAAVAFSLCALCAFPAGAGTAAVEELCRRADRLGLASSSYWRVLGHYRRRLTGYHSLVDDPDFFLSPRGKRDPRAELHATIRALFGGAPADRAVAACRFPARLAWLCEKLAPEDAGIAVPRCGEFEKIIESIDPVSVTLVFPTAYLNSPASLFGHTLLHIRSRSGSTLLSNAVSYSASTRETNGLVFAFKGIFGLYPGFYNVTPYYRKIQQYNDIDQRDIWEYELNFTPAEIRRMMAHIYEFREIYSDYYFFTENCAYELLFLLDAARPGLNFSTTARPWVIPLDTVKAIVRQGLVRKVVYRPSKATRLRGLAGGLDAEGRNQALATARGERDPETLVTAAGPVASRIRVLDTAAEYLQLLRGKKRLDKTTFAPRFFSVLTARSKLGHPELSEYTFPPPPRPDRGHGSLRLSLAAGVREDRGFQQVEIRPAYHDRLDPDEGYIEGAAIEFMGVVLRRWNTPERLQLERLDLLRIESLSPRDAFIKPVSWKVHTGFEREMTGGERHMCWFLNPGGGGTWKLSSGGLGYLLAETDLRLGDYSPEWSLGAGMSAGVLQRLGKRWKIHAGLRALHYFFGAEHNRFEALLEQRFTLGPAAAVTAGVVRRYQRPDGETEAVLGLHLYF